MLLCFTIAIAAIVRVPAQMCVRKASVGTHQHWMRASSPGASVTSGDTARKAMAALGIKDDNQFCEFLLNEAGVAVVAGSGFGAPGHMRISFATTMENLQKAIERIGKALAKGAMAKSA